MARDDQGASHPRQARAHRVTAEGFTLLEVLVALAIAIPALLLIFRQGAISLRVTQSANMYAEAVSRAQSRLDALRDTSLGSFDREGDEGNKFHWHTRIGPIMTVQGRSGCRASLSLYCGHDALCRHDRGVVARAAWARPCDARNPACRALDGRVALNERGFTLLEVLIAVAVLGMLLGLLGQGMAFAVRVTAMETQLSDRAADFPAVDAALRRLIANADPGVYPEPASMAGTNTSLAMVTQAPGADGTLHPVDAVLFTTGGSLQLRWGVHRHVEHFGAPARSENLVLLGGIQGLLIEYADARTGAWRSRWDGRYSSRTRANPARVRQRRPAMAAHHYRAPPRSAGGVMPRGFALLITLWLLVPLSMLFLVLAGSARSDGQIAANLRDEAVLRAAANGGIETAIVALLGDHNADPPSRIAIGDAVVTVASESLAGFVNPNLASAPLLRALLVRVGVAPAKADRLAEAIVEWRTPGQQRAGGMSKAATYRAAGLDYGPPGGPFETIAELGDVLGMTPEILARLGPALSMFTDAPPNPAMAPPLVRSALAAFGSIGHGATDRGAVFHITASATNSRALSKRQAVIRLGPGPRPWRVLAWGSVP